MFKIVVNENGKIPEDDIYYIIGKNGIYLKKKLGIVDALVKVNKISFLEDVETYGRLNIPKIPAKIFGKVISFLKAVYEKYKSESIALIYFNEERKEFKIVIPHQKVSFAGADYVRNQAFKDFTFLATIHSHSSFGASHSTTDKKDEKFLDGLHITVGHVDEDNVDIVSSVVVNGERFPCFVTEYVSGLKIVENPAEFLPWEIGQEKRKVEVRWKCKTAPFNKKWLNKVAENKIEITVSEKYVSPYFQYFPYDIEGYTLPDFKAESFPKKETFDPCSDYPFKAHKMDRDDGPIYSEHWWETGE